MTHKREQILDAIETTLTGLTTTGARVVRARAYSPPVLPALTIAQSDDELVGDQNLNVIRRSLVVSITAHVRGILNLETELNKISAEVYAAIMADPTIGGRATDALPIVEAEPIIAGTQDEPVAEFLMQWRIGYRHLTTSAEV